MSTNQLIKHPHVYKKGKILNLKKLDEGASGAEKKYVFSSNAGSLTTVINSCNNINQIVGRNWLNLSKLLSYFGLSHDISEKLSKKGIPTNFGKYFSDIKRGGDTADLLKVLQENSKKLSDLQRRIDSVEEKLKPKSKGEEEVLQKLELIHKGLKDVLGV